MGTQSFEPDSGVDDGDVPLFADINITPLTDVILVLLIIFMVTSSAMVDAAREGRLDITLPSAQHTSDGSDEASLYVVGLAADGRLFVGGQNVLDKELDDKLAALYATKPATHIVIDADGELPHHKVVHVLDRVRTAGFHSVSIGALAEP